MEFGIPVILESHYGILLNTENGDIDVSATPMPVDIPDFKFKEDTQ